MRSNKKQLSSEQSKELLSTLRACFKKTCTAIKPLNVMQYRQGWRPIMKNYGRSIVYHNGAESYYAARGFRGLLRV